MSDSEFKPIHAEWCVRKTDTEECECAPWGFWKNGHPVDDCWVGGDIDMNECFCGKYPSADYPNGACHKHGTCYGGKDCDGSCL